MLLYEGNKIGNAKSINDMLVECAKFWDPQLHQSTEDINSRVLDSSEALLALPSLPNATPMPGNTHLLTYSSTVRFLKLLTTLVVTVLTEFCNDTFTLITVVSYFYCTNSPL